MGSHEPSRNSFEVRTLHLIDPLTCTIRSHGDVIINAVIFLTQAFKEMLYAAQDQAPSIEAQNELLAINIEHFNDVASLARQRGSTAIINTGHQMSAEHSVGTSNSILYHYSCGKTALMFGCIESGLMENERDKKAKRETQTVVLTGMWWTILRGRGLVIDIWHTCGSAAALINTDSDRGARECTVPQMCWPTDTRARRGHDEGAYGFGRTSAAPSPLYFALLMDCVHKLPISLFLLLSWWRN
ncbi:hypothetical protein E1301_Tti007355 [Triplophysa tibetana]|uniref:Uncharacterized protein n=1 Tax=Triplophysa tibetana TaxID=1572043 RepID=A0A5A9P0L8_9TELE|nr:hypothetical protein E1301_Tti007355 [Triplophysa tibetana]